MFLKYLLYFNLLNLFILSFNPNWAIAHEREQERDRGGENREHSERDRGSMQQHHNSQMNEHHEQYGQHQDFNRNLGRGFGNENVFVAPQSSSYSTTPAPPPGIPGSSTYDYYRSNPQ